MAKTRQATVVQYIETFLQQKQAKNCSHNPEQILNLLSLPDGLLE